MRHWVSSVLRGSHVYWEYRNVERDEAGCHPADCVIVRDVAQSTFIEGTYYSCIVTSDSDVTIRKVLFDKPYHCKFKRHGLGPSDISVGTMPSWKQMPG